MANFDFYLLYNQFNIQANEFLRCFVRMNLGFAICSSIANMHTFFNYSVSLTILNYFFTKIIAYGLDAVLPKQLKFLLFKDVLAEFIALGLICVLLQKSLAIMLLSRIVYLGLCYYSALFSSSLLESLAIAYYLGSAWYLLPVALNLLVSAFYLIDRTLNLRLFDSFIELSILVDLGINKQAFLVYKQDEPQCNPQLMRLIRNQTAMPSINILIARLEKLYAKYPALYVYGEEIIKLPLLWSDFKQLLNRVPTTLHADIMHAYYSNYYHTVWRMLSVNNNWLGSDLTSIKNHKSFNGYHLKEVVMLMWLHSQETNQEKALFRQLAIIYRDRNQINRNSSLFATKYDNKLADMPGDVKQLQDFALRLFVNEIVEEETIKALWKEDLRRYWGNCLGNMGAGDIERLKIVWKELPAQVVSTFNLDEQFKQTFLASMQVKYHNQWMPLHTDYVQQLFYIADNTSHVEKFALVFDEVISNYNVALRVSV